MVSRPSLLLLLVSEADVIFLLMTLLLDGGDDVGCFIITVAELVLLVEIGGRTAFRSMRCELRRKRVIFDEQSYDSIAAAKRIESDRYVNAFF